MPQCAETTWGIFLPGANMTINWIDHGNITLRSPDSLMKDLDDCYDTIKELKTVASVLIKDWSTERDVFASQIKVLEKEVLNWKQISSLAAREIEELRNRRD